MCLKGVEGNHLHTVFGRVLRSVPYECIMAYRALSITETLTKGALFKVAGDTSKTGARHRGAAFR